MGAESIQIISLKKRKKKIEGTSAKVNEKAFQKEEPRFAKSRKVERGTP